jgi:hypothetical protein
LRPGGFFRVERLGRELLAELLTDPRRKMDEPGRDTPFPAATSSIAGASGRDSATRLGDGVVFLIDKADQAIVGVNSLRRGALRRAGRHRP